MRGEHAVFSMIGGIFRLVGLLLLSVLLASCGGGGEGDDGGFTPEKINVTITADKTTLQSNILNTLPNPAGPFTNTITVQVTRGDSSFSAPSVAIDIVSGLSSGALFYLDGKAEHEVECTPGVAQPKCPVAFRRLTFEDTTGTVTAHFHASRTPGTVVLRASSQGSEQQRGGLRQSDHHGGAGRQHRPGGVRFVPGYRYGGPSLHYGTGPTGCAAIPDPGAG